MPNIATVLKAEVTRLARKELRAETEVLRKTVATQRTELAALKRRVQDLEKALKHVTGVAASGRSPARSAGRDDEGGLFRFRAGGMAANRKRLGLSAADFGLLVGAKAQSVYAWEAGKSRPRPPNLAAIAALRRVGKKEVATRLAELRKAN